MTDFKKSLDEYIENPDIPNNPQRENVCIDEKLLPMLKDVIKRLQIIVEAIEDKHGA